MFIRNKSNPIVHMKRILFREDLSNADKILLIRIMLETYEEFEFSIKDYSENIKISISRIKISLVHLKKLGILTRWNRKGCRHRYIVECRNF
jgi:predicted transcriptional regulator